MGCTSACPSYGYTDLANSKHPISTPISVSLDLRFHRQVFGRLDHLPLLDHEATSRQTFQQDPQWGAVQQEHDTANSCKVQTAKASATSLVLREIGLCRHTECATLRSYTALTLHERPKHGRLDAWMLDHVKILLRCLWPEAVTSAPTRYLAR